MADAETTNRFLEVSKTIRELEGKNVNHLLKQKKEQLNDVAKTVDTLEQEYKKATVTVAKEKSDVDKMKQMSTKDFFKDQKQKHFDALSVEQEEYLEAVSRQEMVKKQLDGVSQQKKQIETEVAECGKQVETLLKLYDEQDAILGKIFNGAYGSDLENKLEAEFDALLERKERILVAKYKWSNAKILLDHAVKQLGVAVRNWVSLGETNATPQKPTTEQKYTLATEARNNVIAASQNITSAQRYLNNIKFPYCEKSEIDTLNKACENMYVDMMTADRHKHAYTVYYTTLKRADALQQWFDRVIQQTICKDLEAAKKELAPVEKQLREERLRLIKDKLGDEAADIAQLEQDFRGDTDEFDDMAIDAELLSICEAEGVEGASDNQLSVDNSGQMKSFTPLPLNQLAAPPNQEDLFGNIEQLKQQHEKEMAEFEKAQEINKARVEQGLQEKLAARRINRHARKH